MLDNVKTLYCSKCDLYFTESIVDHIHISDLKEKLNRDRESSQKELENEKRLKMDL